MTGGDLEPRTLGWPETGEAYREDSPADMAALAHRAGTLASVMRALKSRADAQLRDVLQSRAQVKMQVGEFDVEQRPGSPAYNVDTLREGLLDAGMDPDAVEGLFVVEIKVRDGQALNQLATRNADYARAIATATTRSQGQVKVKPRPAAVPAPRTPDHIREHVAEDRRAEAAARARGI